MHRNRRSGNQEHEQTQSVQNRIKSDLISTKSCQNRLEVVQFAVMQTAIREAKTKAKYISISLIRFKLNTPSSNTISYGLRLNGFYCHDIVCQKLLMLFQVRFKKRLITREFWVVAMKYARVKFPILK